MVASGGFLQTHFTQFITDFGSTIIITPVTRATGNYGGYGAVTDTIGTPVTTLGIPSNYMTDADGKIVGKLETGDLTLIVRYTEVVDKFYLVTWQNTDWIVKDIKTVTFQDVQILKRLTVSRKIV